MCCLFYDVAKLSRRFMAPCEHLALSKNILLHSLISEVSTSSTLCRIRSHNIAWFRHTLCVISPVAIPLRGFSFSRNPLKTEWTTENRHTFPFFKGFPGKRNPLRGIATGRSHALVLPSQYPTISAQCGVSLRKQ